MTAPRPPIAAVRAACQAHRGALLGYPVALCGCTWPDAGSALEPCRTAQAAVLDPNPICAAAVAQAARTES